MIEVLKPLEGHRIAVDVNADGKRIAVRLHCVEVGHLRPSERVCAGQGNVMLWNGENTADGAPCGLTMWARGIVSARWEGEGLYLENRQGWTAVVWCETSEADHVAV